MFLCLFCFMLYFIVILQFALISYLLRSYVFICDCFYSLLSFYFFNYYKALCGGFLTCEKCYIIILYFLTLMLTVIYITSHITVSNNTSCLLRKKTHWRINKSHPRHNHLICQTKTLDVRHIIILIFFIYNPAVIIQQHLYRVVMWN